jgi:hypothetical protein
VDIACSLREMRLEEDTNAHCHKAIRSAVPTSKMRNPGFRLPYTRQMIGTGFSVEAVEYGTERYDKHGFAIEGLTKLVTLIIHIRQLINALDEVEDYRTGYPQFSALLALHPAFQNFPRFTRTRMRLPLLEQDEITTLEKSLHLLESQEDRPLFLESMRQDTDASRKANIERLTVTIAEYGTRTNYTAMLDLLLEQTPIER